MIRPFMSTTKYNGDIRLIQSPLKILTGQNSKVIMSLEMPASNTLSSESEIGTEIGVAILIMKLCYIKCHKNAHDVLSVYFYLSISIKKSNLNMSTSLTI